MSSHRSTAMMSTPRSASASACDRPWPRPAPVMKATWPSRELTRVLPLCERRSRGFPPPETARWADGRAGVDDERGAGDIASGVAHQIEDRFGHVLRLNEGHVQKVQALHSGLGV